MRARARSGWAALVALAGAGLVPYVDVLRLWPVSRDATLWITNGAVSSPHWLEWAFTTRQFNVGYRPVTALSYSLNHALGGFAAIPYRVTDLLVHVACGVLVFGLFRRLAPRLPAWGGLVAAAIFWAHPLAGEVVPHLARRSYSLATLFGLAGVLLLMPRGDGGTESEGFRPRAVLGGVALTCAVLSNEVAYLYVVAALFLWLAALADRSPVRATVAWWAPTLILVGGAFVLRSTIVGGVGGYAGAAERTERAVPIALATWRSLAWLNPATSEPGARVASWLLALGAAIAVYYLGRAIAGLVRSTEPEARVFAALVAWVVGFGLLFAPMGVWFPRQSYVVLPPFALMVALAFCATAHRERGARFLAHALPQLLLLAWLIFQAPVWQGGDPVRKASWKRTDAMLRDLHEQVLAAPRPSRLFVAHPDFDKHDVFAFRARKHRPVPLSARQPAMWMNALEPGTDVNVESLLIFREHPLEAALPPRLNLAEDGAILLSPDRSYIVIDPRATATEGAAGPEVRVRLFMGDGRPTLLYFHDGRLSTTLPWNGFRSGT